MFVCGEGDLAIAGEAKANLCLYVCHGEFMCWSVHRCVSIFVCLCGCVGVCVCNRQSLVADGGQ